MGDRQLGLVAVLHAALPRPPRHPERRTPGREQRLDLVVQEEERRDEPTCVGLQGARCLTHLRLHGGEVDVGHDGDHEDEIEGVVVERESELG